MCCSIFTCHVMGFLSRSSSKKSVKKGKSVKAASEGSVYDQPSPTRSYLSLPRSTNGSMPRSANESPSRTRSRPTSEDTHDFPATNASSAEPPNARVPCGDNVWARLSARDTTSFHLDFVDTQGRRVDPALDVYDISGPGSMRRVVAGYDEPVPEPISKRSKRSPLRERTLRERTISSANRPDSAHFLNKYVNSTPSLSSYQLSSPSPTPPATPKGRPATPTKGAQAFPDFLASVTPMPRYILHPGGRYQIRRNADIVASVDFRIHFAMAGICGAALVGSAQNGQIQEGSVQEAWSAV